MSNILRVVLLGKTGAGKSSLGNTLLGRNEFAIESGLGSGTLNCQWGYANNCGQELHVTDTPGLCDTHRSEEDTLREVGKSVAVASPGPHVILMVLRCDRRFTDEEYQAYSTLKALFGPDIRRHMIIVFSGADTYGSSIEQQQSKLKSDIAKAVPNLKKVITDASNRYIAVSNTAGPGEQEQYAQKLIGMMQDLVRQNGGKYFTSKLCEDVNRLVQPIIQANTSGNTTREEATRRTNQAIVNENVGSDFKQKLTSIIKEAVVKAIEIAVGAAVTYAASKCSVM